MVRITELTDPEMGICGHPQCIVSWRLTARPVRDSDGREKGVKTDPGVHSGTAFTPLGAWPVTHNNCPDIRTAVASD